MKKIKLKNIINIHLLILGIIFFSVSPGSTGADITVTTSPSVHSSTGDGNRTWEGTLYAPVRIEVVRRYDEPVDTSLPTEYFLKGRYTGNPKPHGSIKTFSAESSEGFLNPAGALTSDPEDSYHQITNKTITNNKVEMDLRAWDKGAPSSLGIRGQWRLSVPLIMKDGEYNFTTSLSIEGTSPVTVNCILVISTVPEITVADIDFGPHQAGSTLDITKRAEIIVNGGADRNYELTLKESMIELTNPNTSEKIPVELFIEGSGTLRTINSRGTATDFLKASIKATAPAALGTYQNTVTVYLNYN